jgi:transposase InsO family protein
VSRFRFVEDYWHEYPVKRLCRLAEVSTSGFYAWRKRPLSARELADRELLVLIERIHVESRCTYGAPRVQGQLARHGHRVGRKRVARLMRGHRLVGVHARRKWRRGRPDIAPAADLLNRDFTASKPNQRWVADITEFPTDERTLYLAGVRDLCDRSLVGWVVGAHPDAELVVDALTMALWRSTPDPEGLIHHADRGSQYTSLDLCATATGAGLQVSFGSTGDCYDNAAMETFWSTLKREIRWIRGTLRFPPAPPPGSTCSNTSRSSTTKHATRQRSDTEPRSSTDNSSRHERSNHVSTKPGQGQIEDVTRGRPASCEQLRWEMPGAYDTQTCASHGRFFHRELKRLLRRWRTVHSGYDGLHSHPSLVSCRSWALPKQRAADTLARGDACARPQHNPLSAGHDVVDLADWDDQSSQSPHSCEDCQ